MKSILFNTEMVRAILEGRKTVTRRVIKPHNPFRSDNYKQGRYGFCLECGAEISQPRLEALPYASLCIDCASESERRGF